MPIDFRIAERSVLPGTPIVELLLEGWVIGAIYPHGEKGIRMVSAHVVEKECEQDFAGTVIEEDPARAWPPVPSFVVRFDPSPWVIAGNRIVRLPKS
ncbi:MAG: hypothetical protein G01um101438_518 [Parcubacteria group bacterium Gr01-1014_38]|nr:MAG: hypothetical protein G01um101438_518 [Parcubacteria group bacterium Gr01-1014_38]